ncbi:MAG TPA: hypothetical protein VFG33_38580 [Kribbella sp.]|uniref:hypothetical protein n=1 Tax=Kribbella sp. TaxID=1871183 RepID=UPI002D76CD91|nr:hypothetical protein [Kribbella sp.]HET6299336.1 hypothetical protein [Kribbella sp.]
MRTRRASTSSTRVITVIVVLWLLIGLAAAVQRDYFAGSDATCAKVGTTLVTIIAGPLNYIGANPKIDCQAPQPSK